MGDRLPLRGEFETHFYSYSYSFDMTNVTRESMVLSYLSIDCLLTI
jgi:hypothetical protein